jgi:hypothetical protein
MNSEALLTAGTLSREDGEGPRKGTSRYASVVTIAGEVRVPELARRFGNREVLRPQRLQDDRLLDQMIKLPTERAK